MAGHSKWAKIKHAKGIADAKKGKVFSKLSQQLTIASREGGGDVSSNPSLRVLVEKAKAEGLPATNIQRAINKGIGVGQDGVRFEECLYEGVGPGGVSFVIDVVTDNKNRVVSDLRKMFSDVGGCLSESGSLSWNFDQKGRIEVLCGKMKDSDKFGSERVFVDEKDEDVMIHLMDLEGIIDIEEASKGVLYVFTSPQDLHAVKESVKGTGYEISNYSLIRVPKTLKEVSDDGRSKVLELFELLEEYPDIQGIWLDISLE